MLARNDGTEEQRRASRGEATHKSNGRATFVETRLQVLIQVPPFLLQSLWPRNYCHSRIFCSLSLTRARSSGDSSAYIPWFALSPAATMVPGASSARTNHPRRGGPRDAPLLMSMDKPLVTALAVLVIVYSAVTLVTYYKVSDTNAEEQSSLSASTVTADRSLYVEKDVYSIDRIQHMFPIHVGDDVETVRHPGLAMVPDPSKIPEGLPLTMTVPKFFDESHAAYYWNGDTAHNHTIREFLGDGHQLMTPEQAAQIGSFYTPDDDNGDASSSEQQPPLETIYCSVASYRDPECTATVEDVYARAEHPERIRVAIIDQRVDGDSVCAQPQVPCETDPTQALCRYRHLIDVFEMDARLAVGPVFARHLANRHYRGEYFAMQIDSHVRFTEHWDTDIVGQWKSANNEMAVLSTYLSDIINSIEPVTHKGIHPGRPIMCASDYEGKGDYKHLRHGQQPEGAPGITGQPTLHPFWAAGFSFARGHFVLQVPYDMLPMVFQGEEISIGLRGFTYGYDYYAAERSVCFHMYAVKENKERRKKVPLFWENSNIYKGVGMKAMKRLNSIIHMANYPTSEWSQEDVHKYGLGDVRTVDKFFKVFGIHVEEQRVEQHLCRFVGKPMMNLFLPALRPNRMGLDYSKINYEFKDPAPDDKKPR